MESRGKKFVVKNESQIITSNSQSSVRSLPRLVLPLWCRSICAVKVVAGHQITRRKQFQYCPSFAAPARNLAIMKTPPKTIVAACLAFAFLVGKSSAYPLEFSEVSLLVRAHESRATIMNEVTQRKLVRTLTAQQENTLKSQGAPDSLIQALRQSNLALPAADAAAFEVRREQARNRPAASPARSDQSAANQEAPEGFHVFDVSIGHPINLSQWGGPDYEFAFNGRTRLDEGNPDAVLIDNVRSSTHVATYLGVGRPDDQTTIFDRRNYLSVMDHSFTRGLFIDRQNPISMKGVPYLLYPVYAAGGVSLYYIGEANGSVRLAVNTTR